MLDCTINMLNDEKLIDRIVDTCYELQLRDNTKLPVMTNRLKQIEKELDNVMTAIKQGILTPTVKQALDELEQEKSDLELAISKEKIERPTLSKEQIKYWICKFRLIDRNNETQVQQLINTFINSIYVYDDKLLITFNYKDGEKCIDHSEIQEYMQKRKNSDNRKDYQSSLIIVFGDPSGNWLHIFFENIRFKNSEKTLFSDIAFYIFFVLFKKLRQIYASENLFFLFCVV